MDSLKQELIERYENTGRVGFTKPQSKEEAYSLIETICALYQNEQNQQIAEELQSLDNVNEKQIEEVVINLYDLTEKLRQFFDEF